jgi:hypothetical protein
MGEAHDVVDFDAQPFEWYGRVRDDIVFVESAGFWWMEDPTR